MPCVGKYLRAGHLYKDLQKAAASKIATEGDENDVEEHKTTSPTSSSPKLNAPIKAGSTALAKPVHLSFTEAHEVADFAADFAALRALMAADGGAFPVGVWLDKIQEYLDKNRVTDAVADLNKMLAPYKNGAEGRQVEMVAKITSLRDELRT